MGTTSRKYNNYDLTRQYGICIAHNTGAYIYFDLEDYDKIKDYCWCEDNTTGYAKTRMPNNKYISMHRFITNNEYDLVDHINRNKLDNRKENLRNVTKRQNMLNRHNVISTNTSGYTGVSFNKRTNKWRACICVNNKTIHLGQFCNKDDAIIARKNAEEQYYGEDTLYKGEQT